MAMHVVLVIGGGIVLLCLFLLFGKLWGGAAPDFALAVKLFIPIWALIAIINLWVGVTRAGYSMREELPILVLVFATPAILAGVAFWRLAR
ncbi:hypothetical protein [Kaistia granuli]|uniref:hypothetical protein n=1 Tax=Kaistia granuli TaxID=363259 RepID=UPI00037867D0|nr:hypothetical protein [Kaistia granuli]